MASELVTTIVLGKIKLTNLRNGKQILDTRLDHLVKKSLDILDHVQNLLAEDESASYLDVDPDLLQIVYLTEDTIDTFMVKKEAFQKQNVFPSVMHLKYIFARSHFMTKMEKLVGDLSEKSSYKRDDHSARPKLGGDAPQRSLMPKSYSQHDKKTDIFDVEGKAKELVKLILKGYAPFHIFVEEPAVSAKRTIWSQIYSSEELKNHFECRAWVRVPEELDKAKLVIDVLKQVDGRIVDENRTVESLLQDLHNSLVTRIYLVVFVDAPTPDIWEILKYVFPDSSNGSLVIFSFQQADAAEYPDIRFYGREHLIKSTAESKDVDRDIDALIQRQISDPKIVQSLEEFSKYLEKETYLVGLKDKAMELAQLTTSSNDQYNLISVLGVAGSGKTALVKTVYNNPYIWQKFDCRAWVNIDVSLDFELRDVLIDILKQISQAHAKNEEELPLDKLETELTKVLSNKKFLIVLDDMHLPGAWYELESILSPGPGTGSRVILITRDAVVAGSFSPSNIAFLKLNPLKEDYGWNLFLKEVKGDESNQELRNLRKLIWQKCRGLPLAICVLAGLLSSRKPINYSEWPTVIEHIMPGEKEKEKSINTASDDQDQSTSEDILSSFDKLSPTDLWALGYKELSPRLRACVHYLCLFPKSYEIPVRRLFHLWLAEGFVTPSEEEQNVPEDQKKIPEHQMNDDFDQLVSRNMIEVARWRLDGTPKTCRVPSTLYEFFSEERGLFNVHRRSSEYYSTSNSPKLCIRRLAEHLNIKNNTPPDEDIKYLRSYISFNTRKRDKPENVVGNFLEKTVNRSRGFGLLRVLDLEGVYKPILSSETLRKLPFLSYVGLRWTFLDSIPESIGDLPHLEILDLKHTNITALPISIWKAKKLRHLYMNEIHFQIQSKMSSVRVDLPDLLTLWGLLIGSKSPPDNWLESLYGLRKLGLTCHSASLEVITEWIRTLCNLQSLRLRSINDFSEPSYLKIGSMETYTKLTELHLLGKFSEDQLQENQLPPNLKILTLSVSHLANDPMPILEKLKELNTLRLLANSYVGDQMTCHKDQFSKLRVLRIWVLKELKEWTIEREAMPVLRELEIRYCNKLKKIEGLENVTSLKELTLTNMDKDFAAEVKRRISNITPVIENNFGIYPPWD